MIARYWSAQTTAQNAPKYAHYLENTVFSELRHLDGFAGGQLLQRDLDEGVEVVVITFWQSLESIRAFSGDDPERAVVSDEAAALLIDFDRRVRHYHLVVDRPLN